jgi:hypothetical protein
MPILPSSYLTTSDEKKMMALDVVLAEKENDQ